MYILVKKGFSLYAIPRAGTETSVATSAIEAYPRGRPADGPSLAAKLPERIDIRSLCFSPSSKKHASVILSYLTLSTSGPVRRLGKPPKSTTLLAEGPATPPRFSLSWEPAKLNLFVCT